MKTHAIISDIHGNFIALRAVLKDIDRAGIKDVFCLGDIVGYGPQPRECIAVMQERKISSVIGNHDDIIGNVTGITNYEGCVRDALEWTHTQVSEKDREYLKSLPLLIQGEGFSLAHGSPDQLNPFNYVDTDESAFDYVFSKFPELRKTIAPKNLGIIFVGHSHIPAYFYINKSIKNPKETDVHAPTLYGTCSLNLDIKSNHIISCGSVGQPRDEDPRACYVTFDSEKRKINFHRVEYDVGIVQAQMLRAGLPSRLAHRLEHGY